MPPGQPGRPGVEDVLPPSEPLPPSAPLPPSPPLSAIGSAGCECACQQQRDKNTLIHNTLHGSTFRRSVKHPSLCSAQAFSTLHTESTPTGSACLRACVVTGFQLNPAGIVRLINLPALLRRWVMYCRAPVKNKLRLKRSLFNKSLYQAMAISVSLSKKWHLFMSKLIGMRWSA